MYRVDPFGSNNLPQPTQNQPITRIEPMYIYIGLIIIIILLYMIYNKRK